MSSAPPVAVATGRSDLAAADIREVDGRLVVWAEVGDPHSPDPNPATHAHEPDGRGPAAALGRALELAGSLEVPVVVELRSLPGGSDLDGLHAWGVAARHLASLSGRVPLLAIVAGACRGGVGLVLGLFDHVVWVDHGSAVIETAVEVQAGDPLLAPGGPRAHGPRSGLASLHARTVEDAHRLVEELLELHPTAWTETAPRHPVLDPPERACPTARAIAALAPHQGYDVRALLGELADEGSVVEVRSEHAANVVTAYARFGGLAVAVIANQPMTLAGTLDVAAGSKAARHVQAADAFGLPILTLVDTPGFLPGRDQERRGAIRHGAELLHAYCAATVPRVGLILRKAYGGAYIVMDSRGIGADVVLAWPTAEVAVMGAPAAVTVLHRRRLAELASTTARERLRRRLEDEYRHTHCGPDIALRHGLIDQIIEPEATRTHLCAALTRLLRKRPVVPDRRHSVSPC